jgi:hypothetical protein
MRIPQELNDENFQRIYTDKQFRNHVAHAHTCCNQYHKPIYKKAFGTYPKVWAVSEEQIAEAKEEIKRACVKTLAENKGKLLLVGMGWADAKIPMNDIGNPRARGYFRDPQGEKCFIEINHAQPDTQYSPHLWFDFAFRGKDCNFSAALIPRGNRGVFTKANVLDNVNSAFGTSFKEVVIDNYDLNAEDFESIE